MHSFEVHSNESACRKSGRLGLEQVQYKYPLYLFNHASQNFQKGSKMTPFQMQVMFDE